MLKILFFLLVVKVKNFFISNKKSTVFLSNIIILIVVSINVFGIIFLLNYLIKNKDGANLPKIFLNLSYLIIPLVIGWLFVPRFRSRKIYFTKIDPVHTWEKIIIEVIDNFLSSFFIVIIFSLLSFLLFVTPFSFIHFIHAFCITFSSGILYLTIQFVVDQKLKKTLFILALIVLVLGLFYFNQVKNPASKITFLLTPIFLLIYYFARLGEESRQSRNRRTQRHRLSYFGILNDIFFNTKPLRINIVLAVVFKVVFLFILFSKPLPREVDFSRYFKWLLVSPLIYFTYVYNNLWGYLSTTYRIIAQKRSVTSLFNNYLLLYVIVFAFDVFVTFFVLLYFKSQLFNTLWHAVSFYLTTTALLVYIGFYSSVSNPFVVIKPFNWNSFTSNTSFFSNIASVAATIVVGFLAATHVSFYITSSIFLPLFFFYYQQILNGKIRRDVKDIFNAI